MYGREIKLNNEFNNFVRNFELAYWGPNTAKRQVHSPYDIGWAYICIKLTFIYLIFSILSLQQVYG